MIEYKSPRGIVRVVTADAVEDLTRNGWRIMAMGTEERVETMIHREKAPHEPHHYGPLPEKSSQDELREVMIFVMFRDEESEIRDLSDRLRAETELTKEIAEARDRIADENSELEKQVANLQLNLSGSESRNRDRDKLYSDALHKLRKMEADLGAVRKAIGEKQMKEILGNG